MSAPAPALAILELSSIARGVLVADAMVKRAAVRILQNHPVSPGKHLIVAVGEVAEIEEALGAGVAAAGGALVDRLHLAQAHEALAGLLAGTTAPRPVGEDAVAVVETFTVCAAVLGADAAAKAAAVTLLELRLAVGIGGKAYFTLAGELHDVEAAVAAAQGVLEPGLICAVETIAAPHEDLRGCLIW
jgi:microcompartment protein CcmL/EutN